MANDDLTPLSTRGVPYALHEAWVSAERGLQSLLETLGADVIEEAQFIVLVPQLSNDPAALVRRARDSDPEWGWTAGLTRARNAAGNHLVYVVPTAPGSQRPPAPEFLEVHSRLIAWWLAYAWRSQELSAALAAAAESDRPIATAACARPLIETAAAFWQDSPVYR